MIKHCEECGKEFETNLKRTKFCGNICAMRNSNKKKIIKPNKICEECGKPFYHKNDKVTTCSKECTIKNSAKKNSLLKETNKICSFCDTAFYSKTNVKTCSINCLKYLTSENSTRTNIERHEKKLGPNGEPYFTICKNCKKGFWSFRKRKTCSDKCNDILIHGEEKVKKTKETLEKKYGNWKNYLSKKISESNIKKYGMFYTQTDDYKEKVRKTSIEKYGVDHFAKSKEMREKLVQGVINKYGVDNVMKVPEIVNKIRNKIIEKSKKGKLHNQLHLKNFNKWNSKEIINKFVKNNTFNITDFCKYFNISYTCAINKKNNFFEKRGIKNNISKTKTQYEIFSYIQEIYNDKILFNDKSILKNKELDIYIPKHKLAIEYNGIMFHSFGKSEFKLFNNYKEESLKKYHMLEKTKDCEKLGIKLLHINENEWIDPIKKEIWKSIIKNNLKLTPRKINARDCEVKKINNNTLKTFLEKNHLQGFINASIKLGLFYKDELVYVLSFGKPRFNKNYSWELLRNCSKLNLIVRGGFSKLLNYFKKNNKGDIISYGNRRWTSKVKNIYMLGTFINETEPNYFYFNNNYNFKLYSRQNFQKHKLKDKLKNFDENLSETENMYNNKYRKLYDCGNIIYSI